MGFLEINGLSLDVEYDGLDRSQSDVQNFARSEGFTYEGATLAQKQDWKFTKPWDIVPNNALAEQGWIKGRGHYWTFERVDGATTRFNKYSSDGGPGFDSFLSAGTPSKFGSFSGRVGSGDASAVTATFGSEERYSISLWKRDSAGTWILCSLVNNGSGASYYAGFLGTGVTTAFAWLAVSAASGYLGVSLQGEDQTGSSATTHYDGLMILPYALSTPMLSARNSRSVAEPRFPFVEMDGDYNEALQPLTVKGFADAEDFTQVTNNGVKNARALKITLVEK